MTVGTFCKSGAIITLGVLGLSALIAVGAALFVFGATLGFALLGVIIAVSIGIAVFEEISSWFRKRFRPRNR